MAEDSAAKSLHLSALCKPLSRISVSDKKSGLHRTQPDNRVDFHPIYSGRILIE